MSLAWMKTFRLSKTLAPLSNMPIGQLVWRTPISSIIIWIHTTRPSMLPNVQQLHTFARLHEAWQEGRSSLSFPWRSSNLTVGCTTTPPQSTDLPNASANLSCTTSQSEEAETQQTSRNWSASTVVTAAPLAAQLVMVYLQASGISLNCKAKQNLQRGDLSTRPRTAFRRVWSEAVFGIIMIPVLLSVMSCEQLLATRVWSSSDSPGTNLKWYLFVPWTMPSSKSQQEVGIESG